VYSTGSIAKANVTIISHTSTQEEDTRREGADIREAVCATPGVGEGQKKKDEGVP